MFFGENLSTDFIIPFGYPLHNIWRRVKMLEEKINGLKSAIKNSFLVVLAVASVSLSATGCDLGGDDDGGGSSCGACPACQPNYVVVCSNDQDGLSCGCSYQPPDCSGKGCYYLR
jgi:hypothetical protein